MAKSINWCFTLNNYTDEDIKQLKLVKCRYICLGYEIGEETKTPHIQGFIQMMTHERMTKMKKVHKAAHWEIMRGTITEAIDYCKKDGVYEEKGEATSKGQRTDLKTCNEILNRTGKMRDIFGEKGELCPTINVQRSLENKLKYVERVRDFLPTVVWVYGESGIGKSRWARADFEKVTGGCDIYEQDGTKWWDGYDAHEGVIMDDMRGSDYKMNWFLKLIDRYGFRVQTKGGYRQMLAKYMYITSIKHPSEAYSMEGEPINQLLRRISRIVKLTKKCPEVGVILSPTS
jgi:hypothetical protein